MIEQADKYDTESKAPCLEVKLKVNTPKIWLNPSLCRKCVHKLGKNNE